MTVVRRDGPAQALEIAAHAQQAAGDAAGALSTCTAALRALKDGGRVDTSAAVRVQQKLVQAALAAPRHAGGGTERALAVVRSLVRRAGDERQSDSGPSLCTAAARSLESVVSALEATGQVDSALDVAESLFATCEAVLRASSSTGGDIEDEDPDCGGLLVKRLRQDHDKELVQKARASANARCVLARVLLARQDDTSAMVNGAVHAKAAASLLLECYSELVQAFYAEMSWLADAIKRRKELWRCWLAPVLPMLLPSPRDWSTHLSRMGAYRIWTLNDGPARAVTACSQVALRDELCNARAEACRREIGRCVVELAPAAQLALSAPVRSTMAQAEVARRLDAAIGSLRLAENLPKHATALINEERAWDLETERKVAQAVAALFELLYADDGTAALADGPVRQELREKYRRDRFVSQIAAAEAARGRPA